MIDLDNVNVEMKSIIVLYTITGYWLYKLGHVCIV